MGWTVPRHVGPNRSCPASRKSRPLVAQQGRPRFEGNEAQPRASATRRTARIADSAAKLIRVGGTPKGDPTARNRRRAERVPVNSEFGTLPGPTYVSDLSEGGVFVHTDQLLAIGSAVELRFTVLLEDPVVLQARGRVVRHQDDPRGMGIEFTRIAPDVVLRIADVVTHARPRDLGPPLEVHEREDEDDEDDTISRTLTDGSTHELIETRDVSIDPLEGDVEAAQTLVNIKRVQPDVSEDEDTVVGPAPSKGNRR